MTSCVPTFEFNLGKTMQRAICKPHGWCGKFYHQRGTAEDEFLRHNRAFASSTIGVAHKTVTKGSTITFEINSPMATGLDSFTFVNKTPIILPNDGGMEFEMTGPPMPKNNFLITDEGLFINGQKMPAVSIKFERTANAYPRLEVVFQPGMGEMMLDVNMDKLPETRNDD